MKPIKGGGEAERFVAIYEACSDRVMAYALRHVGPDAAEEVVAETFLVAWRRLRDVPGNALPWLIVVARNTMANQRRSGYRQARLAEELARLEQAASTAPSPAVTVEERAMLLRALVQLSATEREALLLVAWDGLSPVQAGRVAGCSAATFTVRLHRARRRLQRALETDPGPVPEAAHRVKALVVEEKPC